MPKSCLFNHIKKVAYLAILLTFSFEGSSQVKDIVASGGDIINGNHVVEASVGQTFVNNNWSGEHYLSEGFQQHHKITVFKDEEDILFKVYPNPTSEVLNIECGNTLVNLNIYDYQGSLIKSIRNLNQTYYQLNVVNFTATKYFIEMIDAKGKVSIQQIIKL